MFGAVVLGVEVSCGKQYISDPSCYTRGPNKKLCRNKKFLAIIEGAN
jgi:hypothetical protein